MTTPALILEAVLALTLAAPPATTTASTTAPTTATTATTTTTTATTTTTTAPTKPIACPSAEEKPDVAMLVQRIEQSTKGASMTGTMKMTVKTPSITRTLKMKLWTKGDDYALVRVVEGGPRETGMMTLKREKQLWNYLPQAARVMKLPSGMLGDSWMGSDFTNDDLVHGSSMAKDFTTTFNAGDASAWNITMTPKESAQVVWGKIEMVVDRKTCTPRSENFYDDAGKLARSMTFADVKHIGDRDFATTMTVATGEAGRPTTITYEDAAFDVAIPDDTFSVHRLEQGR